MSTYLTQEDFNRELLTFRGFMGDKKFWAKPASQRDVAVKAFGFAYVNTQPMSDFLVSMFEGTLREYNMALMDYNEAYYRWVFGPEKDEKANHERLLKMRHIYFSLWRYFLTFIKSIVE